MSESSALRWIDLERSAEASESIVDAEFDGERVLVSASLVDERLGWSLKPEGLCRGDVCVPVRDRAALLEGERIDLAGLAALLGRPFAFEPADGEDGADAAEGSARAGGEAIAVMGVAAAARAASLATGEAPDFALPDLTGQLHRLSEHRGKKVLLIAYASW